METPIITGVFEISSNLFSRPDRDWISRFHCAIRTFQTANRSGRDGICGSRHGDTRVSGSGRAESNGHGPARDSGQSGSQVCGGHRASISIQVAGYTEAFHGSLSGAELLIVERGLAAVSELGPWAYCTPGA
jgi:hypothetical protein